MYIEGEEDHDLKEIIQANKELGQTFDRDTIEFKMMQVYQIRGTKYFIVTDNTGYLTLLYRNMRYKTRFSTESSEIQHISKNALNLMVVSKL